MTMGGGSPPPVQSPDITSAKQQQYNTAAGQSSQRGSMVDQSNPYGSLNYQQIGTSSDGTPIYGSSLNFTPQGQGLFNTLLGTQQTAGQQGRNLLQGANYGNQSPTDAIGSQTSGIEG